MGAGAFAHQRNILLHQERKRAEPGDPILIILDRFKPEPLSQFVQGLGTTALIDGHQVRAEPGFLDIVLEVLFEKVIVELICR